MVCVFVCIFARECVRVGNENETVFALHGMSEDAAYISCWLLCCLPYHGSLVCVACVFSAPPCLGMRARAYDAHRDMRAISGYAYANECGMS